MNKKCNCNKFLTLLENEFYRNFKNMIGIIFGFFVGHLVTAWVGITSIENEIDDALRNNPIEKALEIKRNSGFYDLYDHKGLEFIMLLAILIVVLYTLYIWNREWMGSSKSIYTLLALPIKKNYIILSKLFTMVVYTAFALLVQILTLFLDKKIMSWRIDKRFYIDESVLGVFSTDYFRTEYLNLISRDIFVSIATVLALILLLGLIILLFRSFKIKGLILGVILLAVYVGVFIGVPVYFNLYLEEAFVVRLILSIITSIIAFIFSKFLLENKVGV